MKNTDPRVDAYIAKAAPFARPVLAHLRGLVHEACPEAEETMKWGSPTFTHAGKILCFMAAFKAHCGFGFWHKEMRKVLEGDGAPGEARGLFGRITGLADLPSDRKMKEYVRQAAKWNESDTPAQPRPPRGPAAELEVPADLAAALRRSKAAAKTFQGFAPGQRKEYIVWIEGAKREVTRKKRLATAVEWLSEGKKLNWRYENC